MTDDGPLISPEYAGYVFDAFFSTKPGSTGLGLAISDTIVRKHGGTVSAKNLRDDRGAEFSVTLSTFHIAERQEVIS